MAANEESFICSICLMFESEIRPDWFVATPNGHIFHFKCITDWMTRGNPSCPNCNENLAEHNLTRLRGIDPSNTSNLETVSQIQRVSYSAPSGKTAVDYKFTICMLGASGTGKTTLVERFTTKSFNVSYSATVGSDVRFIKFEIGGKVVHLNIWDTSGQERYNSISQNFVRKAHGVLLVFSYDKPESSILASTELYTNFISQYGLPEAAVLMVGNKIDLPLERRSAFTSSKAEAMSKRLNFTFFETSAKDDFNVSAAFMALVAELIQRVESNQLEYCRANHGRIKLSKTPKKTTKRNKEENSSCC